MNVYFRKNMNVYCKTLSLFDLKAVVTRPPPTKPKLTQRSLNALWRERWQIAQLSHIFTLFLTKPAQQSVGNISVMQAEKKAVVEYISYDLMHKERFCAPDSSVQGGNPPNVLHSCFHMQIFLQTNQVTFKGDRLPPPYRGNESLSPSCKFVQNMYKRTTFYCEVFQTTLKRVRLVSLLVKMKLLNFP